MLILIKLLASTKKKNQSTLSMAFIMGTVAQLLVPSQVLSHSSTLQCQVRGCKKKKKIILIFLLWLVKFSLSEEVFYLMR